MQSLIPITSNTAATVALIRSPRPSLAGNNSSWIPRLWFSVKRWYNVRCSSRSMWIQLLFAFRIARSNAFGDVEPWPIP